MKKIIWKLAVVAIIADIILLIAFTISPPFKKLEDWKNKRKKPTSQ